MAMKENSLLHCGYFTVYDGTLHPQDKAGVIGSQHAVHVVIPHALCVLYETVDFARVVSDELFAISIPCSSD